MNGKFFDLKKEKQDRIINAALKVFALEGYRHASTDDIVREAGISKGLLFHYFGSKLGAYTFVYDYSVRYMMLELSGVPVTEHEPVALKLQIIAAQIRAMKGYPYIQQFLNRSAREDISEALVATEQMKASLSEAYERIHERADYTLLPEGTDGERLFKLLSFAADGLLAQQFEESSFQPDMLYEEIRKYFAVVQNLLYGER